MEISVYIQGCDLNENWGSKKNLLHADTGVSGTKIVPGKAEKRAGTENEHFSR